MHEYKEIRRIYRVYTGPCIAVLQNYGDLDFAHFGIDRVLWIRHLSVICGYGRSKLFKN